jgi:hypothetical protein
MWTCSKCASKVDDQFEVCWNCGTGQDGTEDPNFVPADQAAPIKDPLYDPIAEPNPGGLTLSDDAPEGIGAETVEAYQALSLQEAKFIADQLNAEGINAMSDTQDLQNALGVIDGNPRVYVRSSDLPRARAWLENYEKHRQSDMSRHMDPE